MLSVREILIFFCILGIDWSSLVDPFPFQYAKTTLPAYCRANCVLTRSLFTSEDDLYLAMVYVGFKNAEHA